MKKIKAAHAKAKKAQEDLELACKEYNALIVEGIGTLSSTNYIYSRI